MGERDVWRFGMRVEAVLEEGDYFVHKVDGETSSGGLVVLGKKIARSRVGFLDQLCLDYIVPAAAFCVCSLAFTGGYCGRSWGKMRCLLVSLFVARSAFTSLKMPIFSSDECKCKYVVTQVCPAFDAVC